PAELLQSDSRVGHKLLALGHPVKLLVQGRVQELVNQMADQHLRRGTPSYHVIVEQCHAKLLSRQEEHPRAKARLHAAVLNNHLATIRVDGPSKAVGYQG
ncbi:hypothetical protein T310_8020, partial [Rasamsonia emersonii CBS 393.64]